MVPRWSGWGCYIRSCKCLTSVLESVTKPNSGQGGGLGVHNGQRPRFLRRFAAIDTDIRTPLNTIKMIACSADQGVAADGQEWSVLWRLLPHG